MLVSNNQSSLSWNSSFNKQKQANSRETFNLEFPTEIEIQSDIKTAKKLEINGIEYLEFPSSNIEINSAINSAVSPATAVSQTTALSPATAVSQTTALSPATAVSPAAAVSQTTTTIAVAYGYSVDNKGFMGADFNKAAGLPQDFKIHKSTLDELNKVLQIQNKILSIDIKDNFLSNIDIADTIGQYFGIFSQIVAQKDSFSSDDLKNLPKGYMSDGEDMDYFLLLGSKKNEKVVSVFKDYNSLNEMRNISNAFYNVSSYISELDFSEKNLKTSFNADKSKFNPDMKYYENNDGTYSYESLFIGFLKSSEIMPLRGGNTKVSANAIEYRKFAYQKENNSKNPSIADILNGNVNLQELIKAQIQSNIWLRDNNKIDYQMMQNLKLQGLWFDENTDVAALEKNISSKINGLAPKIYS